MEPPRGISARQVGDVRFLRGQRRVGRRGSRRPWGPADARAKGQPEGTVQQPRVQLGRRGGRSELAEFRRAGARRRRRVGAEQGADHRQRRCVSTPAERGGRVRRARKELDPGAAPVDPRAATSGGARKVQFNSRRMRDVPRVLALVVLHHGVVGRGDGAGE